MPSVFTQVIKGDLPGHFIWRDSLCVAFLSINPVRKGHSLVVPIREVDHWLDLEEEEIQHLSQVGKYVGQALDELFKPQRVGLLIAGFEVPHTHLHIMCINNMSDMDLLNAEQNPDHSELGDIAAQLRSVLSKMGHDSVSDA